MREIETEFFDGKCKSFIEGYRFVPDGETWTRPDGVQFKGEMVSPLRNHSILAAYQEQYETDIVELADADAALAELGVVVDG